MTIRLSAKEAAALVGARKGSAKLKSAPAGRPERKQLIPPQEGELCRIIVPGDPKTLSLNARLHWAVRNRLTNEQKTAAGMAWWKAGKPEAKGKVLVHIIVRRCRVLDRDNCLNGLKGAVDGLFKGCVTKDDGPQYLEFGKIEQQTGRGWTAAHAEIEFVIVEV